MGYRDANGWHTVVQSNQKLKPNQDYDLLLALNGTAATLVIDGQDFFTHVFDPRTDSDGYAYGLNNGLIGLGANNSSARIDNFIAQVLPPEITLESIDDFDDGAAGIFTRAQQGEWLVENGQYLGTGSSMGSNSEVATAYSLADVTINGNYLLAFDSTLNTNGTGGVIFDQYSETDFKFAGLNSQTGEVVIGHYTSRDGWSVDSAANRGIAAGIDYDIEVVVKGTTVTVNVDGQFGVSHAFNSLSVDGQLGLMSHAGATSFDSVTITTDDPAYIIDDSAEEATGLVAASVADYTITTTAITTDDLETLSAEAMAQWSQVISAEQADKLSKLDFEIVDLPDLMLGNTEGDTIQVDLDAALHGWYIDTDPNTSDEFDDDTITRIDMLTVLMHEIGHYLGYEHNGIDDSLMDSTLDTGERFGLDTLVFDDESGELSSSGLEGSLDASINYPDDDGTGDDPADGEVTDSTSRGNGSSKSHGNGKSSVKISWGSDDESLNDLLGS